MKVCVCILIVGWQCGREFKSWLHPFTRNYSLDTTKHTNVLFIRFITWLTTNAKLQENCGIKDGLRGVGSYSHAQNETNNS